MKNKKQDKMIKPIEDKIITNIKNLFEQEQVYYKPVRASNFHSNNYIEYNSNGDKNNTLSTKKYLRRLKKYF